MVVRLPVPALTAGDTNTETNVVMHGHSKVHTRTRKVESKRYTTQHKRHTTKHTLRTRTRIHIQLVADVEVGRAAANLEAGLHLAVARGLGDDGTTTTTSSFPATTTTRTTTSPTTTEPITVHNPVEAQKLDAAPLLTKEEEEEGGYGWCPNLFGCSIF